MLTLEKNWLTITNNLVVNINQVFRVTVNFRHLWLALTTFVLLVNLNQLFHINQVHVKLFI